MARDPNSLVKIYRYKNRSISHSNDLTNANVLEISQHPSHIPLDLFDWSLISVSCDHHVVNREEDNDCAEYYNRPVRRMPWLTYIENIKWYCQVLTNSWMSQWDWVDLEKIERSRLQLEMIWQ